MTFPCIKCKIHKYTKKDLIDTTYAMFEKAWDSRISNMIFPCVKCKIHNYKNTQIRKYKVLKRPNFTFTLHLLLVTSSYWKTN